MQTGRKQRGHFQRQMSEASKVLSDDHSKWMHTQLMVGLYNREIVWFFWQMQIAKDVTWASNKHQSHAAKICNWLVDLLH